MGLLHNSFYEEDRFFLPRRLNNTTRTTMAVSTPTSMRIVVVGNEVSNVLVI